MDRIEVVAFIMFWLMFENAGLPTSQPSEIGEKYATIEKVIRIFSDCHLKFILLEKSSKIKFPIGQSQVELQASKNIITIIIHILSKYNLVYSIFTYKLSQKVSSSNKKLNLTKNHQGTVKYTTCFVHVYIISAKDLHGTLKKAAPLETAMNTQRALSEWPHHSILIENSKIVREQLTGFVSTRLQHTATRGLVVTLDSTLTTLCLICIPCSKGKALNTIQPENFEELIKFSSKLNNNLRRKFLKTSIEYRKIKSLKYCNFMSPGRPKIVLQTYYVCIHLVLQNYLNYTYELTKSKGQDINESSAIAFIYDARFVSEANHRIMITSKPGHGRSCEWIPFGARFEHFQFVAFQERPSISRSIIVEPYDWKSWTLFLITSFLLVGVTKYFELNQQTTGSTVISMVASILEQSVSVVLSKRVIFGSQLLSLAWLQWALLLIVIVNGYKGTLFTMLTHNPRPIWPENLKDLMFSDRNYCVFSTSRLSNKVRNGSRLTSSMIQTSLLNPIMKGKSGVPRPPEYMKLNQSIKVFLGKNSSLTEKIIRENRNGRTHLGYKIGNERCSYFSQLDPDPIKDSIMMFQFVKGLIASLPVKINGYLQVSPYQVSRNFIHERIAKGFAQVEASGIMGAFKRYALKWFICREITGIENYLGMGTTKITGRSSLRFRRCLHVLANGISGMKNLLKEENCNSITTEQLHIVLDLCITVTFLSLFLFILELVTFRWKT